MSAARIRIVTLLRPIRSLHQSTPVSQTKKEYPTLKELPIQPVIQQEWEPPSFPKEIEPALPFRDVKGREWRVAVAACISRLPKITPDKSKEEIEYSNFRAKVTNISSLDFPHSKLFQDGL